MANVPRREAITFGKLIGLLTGWGSILLQLFPLNTYITAQQAIPKYSVFELPKINPAAQFYYVDGSWMGSANNQAIPVSIEQLPDYFIEMLIASEDPGFWDRDPSIIRTGKSFISADIDPFGNFRYNSPPVYGDEYWYTNKRNITQELANLILLDHHTNEWSYTNGSVVLLADKLDRQMDKNDILNLYMNKIEIREHLTGLGATARWLYNKPLAEFNIQEAALLIGMMGRGDNAPFKNGRNPVLARNEVLEIYAETGKLNQEALDSLTQLPSGLTPKPHPNPQVLHAVLKEWEAQSAQWNVGSIEGPIKVYTTIDPLYQQYAEYAVREHIESYQPQLDTYFAEHPTNWELDTNFMMRRMQQSEYWEQSKVSDLPRDQACEQFAYRYPMVWLPPSGRIDTVASKLDSLHFFSTRLEAGFVVEEQGTGNIKAWVGKVNPHPHSSDWVNETPRTVGTAIKPLIFGYALKNGEQPCALKLSPADLPLEDMANQSLESRSIPLLPFKSYLDGASTGISIASLTDHLDADDFCNQLDQWGFNKATACPPAIFLGTSKATLLELTTAYSPFHNQGRLTPPRLFTRVETAEGPLPAPALKASPQLLDEEAAAIVRQLLSERMVNGPEAALVHKFQLAQPIAAFAGNAQELTDGWFIGMTDDLLAGVWTGFPDPSVHIRSLALGNSARSTLPIWSIFMREVYADSSLGLNAAPFPASPAASAALECE